MKIPVDKLWEVFSYLIWFIIGVQTVMLYCPSFTLFMGGAQYTICWHWISLYHCFLGISDCLCHKSIVFVIRFVFVVTFLGQQSTAQHIQNIFFYWCQMQRAVRQMQKYASGEKTCQFETSVCTSYIDIMYDNVYTIKWWYRSKASRHAVYIH